MQVKIAETSPKIDDADPQEANAKHGKLFVGMLTKTITEEELVEMFGVYGILKEVHLIRGRDGSSKGCAFVKYFDKFSAFTAINEMHDKIPPVF